MLPPHKGQKYLLSPRGVMAIEVPYNEEICGRGKNGGKKEIGSAMRRTIANRKSINIKQ